MTRKAPVFFTPDEAVWYEQTPKRVLFAMARDYAMQNVGENHAFEQPDSVLAELKERQRIIVSNQLDQAYERKPNHDQNYRHCQPERRGRQNHHRR